MDARTLTTSPLQSYLEELHRNLGNYKEGEVASYIPELLRADPDWFGITIDNISGGLWNVSPVVTYLFTRNFGVSASYQFINFSADVDQDTWNGGFDLGFGGPSLRLVVHF